MKESKCNDKEDHLEESDKDVGWRNHQSNDTKYCRNRSLKNGQSETVQTIPDSVIRSSFTVQVMIGDVGGKVNREPE